MRLPLLAAATLVATALSACGRSSRAGAGRPTNALRARKHSNVVPTGEVR